MQKSIRKTVNDWFNKYKSYVLLYRGGFWEIPYMSNSPETIVKSILKMPFTKHSPKRNHVLSKTPLIKGEFYYEELEKGLWLIQSNLEYQANINYVKKGEGQDSANWYLLNLTTFGLKQKLALMDGIPHTNCAWLFYKPNSWATNCHFKGAHEMNLAFYVHKDWLKEKLKTDINFSSSPLNYFMESRASYDIWNDSLSSSKKYYNKVVENFSNAQERTKEINEELRTFSLELIDYFISKYEHNNISLDHFKVSDKTRVSIYKIEKLLLERLGGPFPGLDFLTKEASISETSLKVNFKHIFGTSTAQYFQQKQMFLAKEILETTDIKIKDLSLKMGYLSHSKFTAAFKKHNGILPSEISQSMAH
jgi:AraC-like DNA-binding protein